MPIQRTQMFYNGLPEIVKRENNVRFAKAYQERTRQAGVMRKNANKTLFDGPNGSPETFMSRFYTRRMFAVAETLFRPSRRKRTVQRAFNKFGKTDFLLRMPGENRLRGGNIGCPTGCAAEHDPNGKPQYPEYVFHTTKVGRSFGKDCQPFSKAFSRCGIESNVQCLMSVTPYHRQTNTSHPNRNDSPFIIKTFFAGGLPGVTAPPPIPVPTIGFCSRRVLPIAGESRVPWYWANLSG